MSYLEKLKAELRPVYSLRAVSELLTWDQETFMPESAAEARAEQVAIVAKTAHSIFCSDEMGILINKALQEITDPHSEDAHLVRLVATEYERAHKVPTELVSKLSEASSRAQTAWVTARKEGDFALMQDEFAEVVELSRQTAEYYGYKEHIYDAMLQGYEPGTTVAQLDKLFAGLRPHLVDLVERIKAKGPNDTSLWNQRFPNSKQRVYAKAVTSAMGYDWKRGRTDEVIHPFCCSFSTRDVRITNTYKEYDPCRSLFTALHETGHAIYEQGSPERWMHTPLEGGASIGWHETMSRLWENIIGRSLPFWEFSFPRYRDFFPDQLEDCGIKRFYKAINIVEPSCVRTEADEVTYNLHIMLRYELEKDLLSGKLAVKDIPEAWNESMKSYFGIVPKSDTEGCTQDIHWPAGLLGYFPSYAIGNIRSAQIWERMCVDIPNMDDELRRGNLLVITDWLQEHVFCWGRRLFPNELQMEVVGQELSADAYVRYLDKKYTALYNL